MQWCPEENLLLPVSYEAEVSSTEEKENALMKSNCFSHVYSAKRFKFQGNIFINLLGGVI